MANKQELIIRAMAENPNLSNGEIARKLIRQSPEVFSDSLPDSLRRFVGQVRLRTTGSRPEPEPPPTPDVGVCSKFTQQENTARAEGVSDKEIRSLEDLVEFFNIDLDRWKVKKWECSVYESHTRLRRVDSWYQVKTGYARIDDEHKVVPLYRVWASLEENRPLILLNDIKAEMIAELQGKAPQFPKYEYVPQSGKPCLLEINIFDLHFGKLAWDEETGNNYDIRIAREMFLACVHRLIEQAKPYPVERVVFPIGNDFFNVDNSLETTARSTPQDEDTRWKKTFVAGRKLIIEAIDSLSKLAPVDVPVIPGNHDLARAFYLGDAVECWYHSSPNVSVDNGAKVRKYYRYGKCLIGYTHGSEEKHDDLPYIMANEEPALWAETAFREWHIGDKHHKKSIRWMSTEEFKGVTVRFMRSLAGTDVWHYSKGFVGANRAGQGFVWDKQGGLVCEFSANF